MLGVLLGNILFGIAADRWVQCFSLLIPQEVRSQRFASKKQAFLKIAVYTKIFKLRRRIIFWT
jgi:hypothetical protein